MPSITAHEAHVAHEPDPVGDPCSSGASIDTPVHKIKDDESRALTPSVEESKLTILLRLASERGDAEEAVRVLTLCDDIYYSGKAHTYKGHKYTVNDLPSDEVYTMYRKKFTPDLDLASLYVKGKANVRGDDMMLHDYPMGSLAKFDSSSVSKLQSIFARMGNGKDVLAVSLKIDGVSMQAHFVGGKLIKAVTRYDHKTGRSVIEVAKRFVHRPDPSFDGKVVVGGEVVLKGKSYLKLGFVHPRNGAAGILNRKSISHAPFLDYIAWDLLAYEPTEDDVKRGWPAARPKLISDQFELLTKLGYEVAPLKVVGIDVLSEESLNAMLNAMAAVTDVPSDGLVVSPNAWVPESVDPPKMKVAYKGPSPGDWTVVTSIEPHATRTGNVIPQVTVEAVHVGGVMITSIAGANYTILLEKNICIGSRVFVTKAKEVIPFIESVDNEGVTTTPPAVPATCPSCGSKLGQENRMLKCPNPVCPAKGVGQVQRFLDVIGLKGIGDKKLASLSAESLQDLYSLTVPAMMQIKGIGHKTAQSIYDQLRSCINPIGEATLLAAIGPPLIGEKTAELIVGHVHLDVLFGETKPPPVLLQSIKGIGPEKAEQLYNFHREGVSLIKLLESHGMTITRAPDAVALPDRGSRSPAAPSSGALGTPGSIEVVCMTGKGSLTRADYEVAIKRKGWLVVNAVSSKVTLVVTDDITGTSSKMEKARVLGKKIVLYEEFDKML